jgi:hypothetical protein
LGIHGVRARDALTSLNLALRACKIVIERRAIRSGGRRRRRRMRQRDQDKRRARRCIGSKTRS